MHIFYPVVDTARKVEQCVDGGARFIQLRLKNLSTEATRQQARQAHEYCRSRGAQLVLNDHWQLALELGIDHVHLGQEDMDTADFKTLRHAGIRFGLSTHDRAELARARSLEPDYIALGPIYATQSKKMKWAPQGLERVKQWKQAIGTLPLVTIGGMIPERAAAVLAAGADSIAVMRDVQIADDPAQRCRIWLTELAKTRHAKTGQ